MVGRAVTLTQKRFLFGVLPPAAAEAATIHVGVTRGSTEESALVESTLSTGERKSRCYDA
ncbi:MAG: hypothetical protein ABFS86_07120 [Planctomycetota bacterium]